MDRAACPSSTPRIVVGIPCYNRPHGLQETIRCLQAQTFQDWRGVICDNASPDPRVAEIGEDAARRDPRFRYHRHPTNLGAIANFHFAAHVETAEFFMWGSDDDLWRPQFMETNLRLLEHHPQTALAFCAVESINRDGEVLFRLPSFAPLSSRGNSREDLQRYLEAPEKCGKANLIYGLFRTPALRDCLERDWEIACTNFYAADLVFLFALVCRYSIVAHDAYHFSKRQPTGARRKIRWRHPRSYRVAKGSELESYIARLRAVSPTPEIADLVEQSVRRRQRERWLYLLPQAWRLLDRRLLGSGV